MPPQNNKTIDLSAGLDEQGPGEIDLSAGLDSGSGSGSGSGSDYRPMTPEEINIGLPANASPVGTRTPTVPEQIMTSGRHPAMTHPTSLYAKQPSRFDPVTRQPRPGRSTTEVGNTETKKIVGSTLPAAGAMAATAVAPEVELPWLASALWNAGVGAAGAMEGRMLEHPYNKAAGLTPLPTGKKGVEDLAETGGEYAAADLGTRAVTWAPMALLRRYFPEVHELVNNVVPKIKKAIPGNESNYEDHVLTSLWDLQKIAQQQYGDLTGVFALDAPGGFITEEKRLAGLTQGIVERQDEIYNTERLPQIQAAAGIGTTVPISGPGFSPEDAKMAMIRVKRTLIPSDPLNSVITRIIADPTIPIPISDANDLAMAINKRRDMLKLGQLDPSAASSALASQQSLAALDAADQHLKTSIDGALQAVGQPGLGGYEVRYAALSSMKRTLLPMLSPAERARFIDVPLQFAANTQVGPYLRAKTVIGENPGRKIEEFMKQLAKGPNLDNPLAGAVQATPTPAGALPSAPIAAGPVPPGPPGPPATGTHFPPGTAVPPWSAYAQPQGPMTPSNIAQTGIQEPLPTTPSVPAQGMPPTSEVPTASGPTPQPASQMPLGASNFPDMPKSPGWDGTERRLPTNADKRDTMNAWLEAGTQIDQLKKQMADPKFASIKPHLEEQLHNWEQTLAAAEDKLGKIPQSGLDSPEPPTKGAPRAGLIPEHIRTALQEAGLGESNYLGTKSGMVNIRTGYQTKPMVEGGEPGTVDIAFREGEPITGATIKAKIQQRLKEFGDSITNR